jgi:glycosyltransferase involved in cell wall biosynthesis
MRILVVAPYPPRACGIGEYARGQVDRLRGEGHEVTVLSPPDGDGDLRVPFTSGRPFFRAARIRDRYERIVVHFQPALYFRSRNPVAKVLASLGLLWLCLRARQAEVLVHEADRPRRWRIDEALLIAAFRAAPLLVFHTEIERRSFERWYRVHAPVRLEKHTGGIAVHASLSRAEARRRLGVGMQETLFVCPGFLHPDKGFERAVDAFARVGGGRLVIVGSVRDETPVNRAYAGGLRGLVAGTPGTELIDRFVPPEDFDAWIAAADAVVLPYRRSWSSGALARAQVLGTPAVVTAVGGLEEQAGGGDIVVRSDEELEAALARLAAPRKRRVRA